MHETTRVDAIMSSPVVSVPPTTSLGDVMRLMDEEQVRHVPVLEGERLCGMLCDRDLLEATGWLPDRLREVYQKPGSTPRTASDIARRPVMTAHPEDDVTTITVEAVVQGVGALPVLDGERLVGVVSEVDLMRAWCEACRGPGARSQLDGTVATYMTRAVTAVDTASTLGDALRTMREQQCRHLPVVQAGHLVGVVSDRDLRRELGRGRREDYPVTQVMTRNPAATTPREPLSAAVGRMVDARISSLPVLSDEELVGILTTVDVLDHCMNHLRTGDGAA